MTSGIIAVIIMIGIVRVFGPITIDLSEYKGAVESAANLALVRSVYVDDKIIIATSRQPYFSLEGLRIANPEGFQALGQKQKNLDFYGTMCHS